MKKIKYIFLSAVLLGFTACNDDDYDYSPEAEPLPELTAGDADFSNFVAVGASFTAGFTDNALFINSQMNSFPNIMADQFAKAGGGMFNQPLMNDNFGGLTLGGMRITEPRLVFGGAGPVPLEAVIGPISVSTDITNNPTGPFSNLGIPGAKSFHLVAPGYGNIQNFPAAANPYAVRVTGSTPNASILDLAVAQTPTFFTLSEVGGNDVLGFATSGGTTGFDDITPQTTFDAALNALVDGLTTNGAKGAIGNLPNITSLSYFTTVPNNALALDEATAANLTGFFQALTGIFTQGLVQQGLPLENAQALASQYAITFNEGANRFLIDVPVTPANPLGFRQMTEDELLLLPIDQDALAQGYGSVVLTPDVLQVLGLLQAGGTPTQEQANLVLGAVSGIDNVDALDSAELSAIQEATAGYNQSIEAVATANGLALVDLNSILVEASTAGLQFDDYFLNTDLVFGGLVSLDGVHLTSRGYALMANSFLKAIDATYGSNFEASGNLAKAGDYPTNYSPALQ
ncbi:SGNH/GDSL hydrolase family protein [Winogradskyella bathintestinalis]|uniref:G-D-S-L family lipolytic protein n=1 Tax=Winogradskyella bathintestinalis TaxID=3035208 RepID=A0ABT7ZS08_9FLAO|nr:G-D-S-L family lipolytic protein [Winogradskyella bathintestinalis]MDN3491802.1 G-D-S-L family lipolytic protein [Winogradskyella bathintestinalis]